MVPLSHLTFQPRFESFFQGFFFETEQTVCTLVSLGCEISAVFEDPFPQKVAEGAVIPLAKLLHPDLFLVCSASFLDIPLLARLPLHDFKHLVLGEDWRPNRQVLVCSFVFVG